MTRELLSLPALYRSCEMRPAEEAVRVCADIVDILASWCSLVVHERGAVGPGARIVEDMTVFLDMSLGWLAKHDAASDFVIEVRELVAAAHRATEVTAEWLSVTKRVPSPARSRHRARRRRSRRRT